MSDTPEISADPNTKGKANLIYIFYLASLVTGITGIIGVVMAYISKNGANDLLTNHYNNQINIFWKMVLYSVVGIVLSIVLIGFLILIAALVWYVIRCVQGIQALSRGEKVANPGSWLL